MGDEEAWNGERGSVSREMVLQALVLVLGP